MNGPVATKHTDSSQITTRSEWQRSWHIYNVWLDSWWPQSRSTLPSDSKPSSPQGLWAKIFYAKWFRVLVLFYTLFCVILSLNHIWWSFTSKGLDWIPERTFDHNKPYSLMDSMSHSMKMSKVVVGNYDTVKQVQPYWLKASDKPNTDEVTLITVVSADRMNELVRLAGQWRGSVSAVLRASEDEVESIRATYLLQPMLYRKVDIHLIPSHTRDTSILLSGNAERNIGRMYARTDYICEMPSNVVLSGNLKETVKGMRGFNEMMHNGDMLVVPLFQTQQNRLSVSNGKDELIRMLDSNKATLSETAKTSMDIEHWKTATSPYIVQDYSFQYDPIVIQSKTVLPWCPERFTDSRAACIMVNYLAGGELRVLPNDFLLQGPGKPDDTVVKLDDIIESRLLAKFYWEQCVFQARNLAGMGLWKSERSHHIRNQCFRVIRNWAKGLIE